MDQIVLFVLLGLAPGALIAAMALGVVLAYRARASSTWPPA